MSTELLPIANAFITWLSPQLGALGLAAPLALDPQKQAHPRMPADPVAECPQLVLSLYTQATNPKAGRDDDFASDMSLWFYRRQIAGQNHQQKMAEALDTLGELLKQQILPTIIADAGAKFMMVIQKVYHDELSDPLGRPRLRVNPGEVQLKFLSR